MDRIIKLLDVIIWPSLVLILFIMLRKPIKSLLSFVENIKYKDFEVKFFRKDLDQLKEEAKEAGIDLQTPIGEKTELYKLIEISPSSAILESWKELELAARKKVEELAPRETKYKNPLQRPIAYLEYTGALIPSTARAIRELQSLRNQAAHMSDVKITKEDALEYSSLAKGILKQIEAIRELPRIKLTALTLIISELNHLIDSGKYTHITIEDAHKAIEQKRVIPFLAESTKGDSDFSLYGTDGPYAGFVEYYHEQMYQIYCGYAGNERRKWGIENLGLCLLLAWTNEIIQQGAGWHPNE
ncbi:MAG TPA: hypothetical protein ACFYEL_09340 [Candidatus Wunengus californicus]|uniref:hypothetical protein n=1 Tax=Candidatus Wunengus californicus TaxID=3367619 RepID=UPI004027DC37